MRDKDNSSLQMTAASLPSSDGRPSVAPQTRPPYEVYSQPLEDRDHAKRELMALVDGTPNFEPHYYAVCKSGLAIAVNIGGRNAAKDIPFLAHAANHHHDLLEALRKIATGKWVGSDGKRYVAADWDEDSLATKIARAAISAAER